MMEFQPSEAAAQSARERCPEVRSLVGVFDGHKRHEPAEMAAKRLPQLLARSALLSSSPLLEPLVSIY